MNKGTIIKEESLAHARNLVLCLETDRQEEAKKELGELTRIHETEIFRELGQLTRELHNNLTGFHVDDRMTAIAENDIQDATERMNYVIEMTNQAAHKTLNAVEASIPICDEIYEATSDISEKWRKFTSRDMTAEQFRVMASVIGGFLETASDRATILRNCLNDILIAQDYQDLTGQTLRRVIDLVQEVEAHLVGFIRVSSPREEEKKPQQVTSGLQGPQIPGKEGADAVKSQDEVDELLSSLGF